MSLKKNILIWANCQGSSIHLMINKYYSHLFTVDYLLNYEFIRNNLPVPDQIKNADIFLYQNYSETETEYDLKNIINNYLKKDCLSISFPTLHSCPLLFCHEYNESNNRKTINDKYPHGKFFFGINIITDLLKKYDYKNNNKENNKIMIDEIYKTSQSFDFISNEKIEYYSKRNFEFLEKKILSSDVPELFDFIKNNFTKVRLWHNPNHPTGILLNELVMLIFKKLNLIYQEEDKMENIKVLDLGLKDWEMPIFPSVKKYYHMNFQDKCSSSWHPDIVDSKTYITKYLNELYLNEDEVL